MRTLSLAALIGVTLAADSAGATAQSFCMQPTAPTAYISRPNRPFCAAARNCSSFDVDMYRGEVQRYFERLRRYANEVDEFHSSAATYIECMSRLD